MISPEESRPPPKLLITGATGFLGTALRDAAYPGYRVVTHGHSGANADTQADLRDPNAVATLLDRLEPEVVIHAAAHRDPDFCETHPEDAAALNRDAVGHLRDALPDDALLVFISTDYVFAGDDPPYTETDAPDAVNVYGQLKAEAEAITRAHPRHLVIRIPVLVGQDPPGARGFVTQMVEAVRAREPQTVDDRHVRCPTWTRDVATNLAFLIDRNETGTWHLASDHCGTRHALTVDVARHLGLPHDHLHPSDEPSDRPAPRPLDSTLATDKLKSIGAPGFHDLGGVLDALGVGNGR